MDKELKKKLVEFVSHYEWSKKTGLIVWISNERLAKFADYFSTNSTMVDGLLAAYLGPEEVCLPLFHRTLYSYGASFREIVEMFPEGASEHWIQRHVE